MEEQHFVDGDIRHTYVGFYRTHILYLWHIADTFGILRTVKCVLDPSVAASSLSIPTAEVGTTRKRKGIDEDTKMRQQIGATMGRFDAVMGSIGYSSIRQELRTANLNVHAAELSLTNAKSDGEKKVWRKRLVAASETDKEIEDEKNLLKAEKKKLI